MRESWARDAGMRIDHLLVGPGLPIVATGVDRDVRGQAGASDHAPAWLEVMAAEDRAASAMTGTKKPESPGRTG